MAMFHLYQREIFPLILLQHHLSMKKWKTQLGRTDQHQQKNIQTGLHLHYCQSLHNDKDYHILNQLLFHLKKILIYC